MSANRAASWAYAEQFVAESPTVEEARERGLALGAVPVGLSLIHISEPTRPY